MLYTEQLDLTETSDEQRRYPNLISPSCGELVDLSCGEEERIELLHRSYSLPKIQLSARSLCDYELLATGAFSPVKTFLGRHDYENVVEQMRLADGTLFPIPVTLPVDPLDGVRLDAECTLVDQYNDPLAIIRIEEIYKWDAEREARLVYGTTDPRHPLVAEMQTWGKFNVAGKIRALNLPKYYDFKQFRLTPAEVRKRLQTFGKSNVVAFQTRNPLHRAHEEMTKRAVEAADGILLLHPVVGMTQPGDIEYYTRVRSYKRLIENHYKEHKALLALLPLAMRMAGPREALWHSVIRRNYGADHLIIGRYHATPSATDSQGNSFYGEYEAQQLVLEYEKEIGVSPVLFSDYVYLPDENRYDEVAKIPKEKRYVQLSGTAVRKHLKSGENIPEWHLRPAVAEVLKESSPPRHRQGFCIWFTGLSGAGKSTIANILTTKLLEHGRRVSLLDGDVVRTNLSKGLGFTKEDRDTNIRRIGFVAAEIVKHGGAVICAAISPYRSVRNECRSMIGESSFIEAYVNTPLEICEARDTKGLYSLARSGKLKNFTGIDDPYEVPLNPELTLNSENESPDLNAEAILGYLIKKGFVIE